MATVIGSPAATFPQTGANLTQGAIIDDIAEYQGGKSRPDILNKARQAWRDAIGEANGYKWHFNRVNLSIDLAITSAGFTNRYDLTSDFYKPGRAVLVNAAGDSKEYVRWVSYFQWRRFNPDQESKGNVPVFYTADDIFQDGQIIIDPPLNVTTLQFPTMNLDYFKRIAEPATDSDLVIVPKEMEKTLRAMAVANFISKMKTFREGKAAQDKADRLLVRMMDEYRDYEDG